MSTQLTHNLPLELAHVLFIDLVGYSKLLIDEQYALQEQLNLAVRGTKEFRAAEQEGKLVRLPTGDGMALVFFTSPDAPVKCALEISEAVKNHPQIRLRMGINTGPVSVTTDVNDRSNVAGVGINVAKRVMDFGDAGHILLTSRAADDLAQYRQWQPYLHELGNYTIKHGSVVSVFNLYGEGVGNPAQPEKLRPSRKTSLLAFVARYKFAAFLLIGFAIIAIIAALKFPRSIPRAIEKSIAVLPFENLSDNPENAYFAGGMQDDILTNLAKIGDLKVISRTSVMQFKKSEQTAREIGKILGVATVLEGSVRRVANRVRVNVQLIDTSNDAHLWAENYERELIDVFAIQTDLAIQIAATLQTKLSPTERTRLQQRPTQSFEAYLIYLQAQDALSRCESNSDLEKVAQLYEKAIQLDPSFALALARLSYLQSTLYQATRDQLHLEKARSAATEALRLQPNLPEGHLALGYVYYRADKRDYERALSELALAKSGMPNDPDVSLVLGSIERRQGKWPQSTADLEKAASVNPRDAFLWLNLAANYQALRNFPAAEKAFDRGAEADPSHLMNQCLRARMYIAWRGDTEPMERLLNSIPESTDLDGRVTLARFELRMLQRRYDEALQIISRSERDNFSGFRAGAPLPKAFLLGQIYRDLNENEKARAAFEEALGRTEDLAREKSSDPWLAVLRGQIYAALDRKDDAIRWGEEARKFLPESEDAYDGPAVTTAVAQIYSMLGESKTAIPLLEHSLSTPGGITVSELQLQPVWDSLRSQPGFEKLASSKP